MIFKDGLPYLSKTQWDILIYVRTSPHRVSIRDISRNLHLDIDETRENVIYLVEKEMLRQDSRDRVPPEDPDVTFYTNPDVRRVIDSLLSYLSL